MTLPFKGLYIFTQDFGANPDNYKQFGLLGHNGLDFGCPTRTEIVAPHAGKVIEVNYDQPGYGWYVKIESDFEGSVIAHLEAIDVQVGYELKEGDHIGWSDNTGNSTGPHCHWGYYIMPRNRGNGYAGFIDQKSFLAESGIQLTVGELPLVTAKGITPTPDKVDWHGLDPNNTESIQEAINTWYNVAHGAYKTLDEYNSLSTQLDIVKKQLEDTQKGDATMAVDLKNYTEMKALGYNTLNDITGAIKAKDDTVLALQKENAEVRKRNGELAQMVSDSEKEDHVSADLGQKQVQDYNNLRERFVDLLKILNIDTPSFNKLVEVIMQNKDLAEKFMQHLDKEHKTKLEQVVDKVTESLPTKQIEQSGLKLVMQLFQLIPSKKEVK